MSLFSELKRRNVFRVAAAYIVIGWLLLQVADTLTPALHLPEWIVSAIALVLILGIVPTLLFSWAYELTPEGLKKDSEVDKTAPHTSHTAKKLDVITLVAVVGVVGLIAWQQFNPPGADPAVQADTQKDNAGLSESEDAAPAMQAVNQKSIAVLPFAALSDDESDVYFGKGIAEELLNALAQFPDLKVAARTSAFSFEGKDTDIREVGEHLGVAHILEGSIRRSGERIRITAQLIRAADGFHLWSETFERELTDIFVIQDEIVRELSRVLQFRLGVGAGTGRASEKTTDPTAYDQYLRGLNYWAQRDIKRQNRFEAIRAFTRATELDPDFADGWAALSMAQLLSPPGPNENTELWNEIIDRSLARALELDPDNARAHAALSYLHANYRVDVQKAQQHLARALELAPNAAFAHYTNAQVLSKLGDYPAALAAFERAMDLDPFNVTIFRVHKQKLSGLGRAEEALAALDACSFCPAAYKAFGGMQIAITAGNDVLRQRREKGIEFSRALESPIEFFRDAAIANDVLLGEKSVAEGLEAVSEDAFAARNIIRISNHDDPETILDLLFDLYESNNFFAFIGELMLMPNRFQASDALRRHPRYHEFWALPGMPELAEVRKKNGSPWGLPLPVDGSEAD